MSAGDRWRLPDGRVAPIRDGWPFPCPPEVAARRLCHRLPSRYLHGQVPAEPVEEARW